MVILTLSPMLTPLSLSSVAILLMFPEVLLGLRGTGCCLPRTPLALRSVAVGVPAERAS